MSVHITKENFEAEVLTEEKKVLIDFYADWCGPCKMIAPLIEEVAHERQDIKVCKINIDEQPELARQFGVMSIPTLVVMENKKVMQKNVGALPKHQILQMLT